MRLVVFDRLVVIAAILQSLFGFCFLVSQTVAFSHVAIPTRAQWLGGVPTTTTSRTLSPPPPPAFVTTRITRLHEQRRNDMADKTAKKQDPNNLVPQLLPSIKKRKTQRMALFAWLNQPAVEVILALAVLLSSLLVALGTLDDLPAGAYVAIRDALLALNLLLAVDFMARWYAAGQFKLRYLSKPFVVIDIVVIWIPLFLDVVLPLLDYAGVLPADSAAGSLWYGLQNAAGLQNLLLLRVLRLRRVLTDVGTFRRFGGALGVIQNPSLVRPYQLQLARVLLSIFTLLSVASGLIYTAEHDVNPGISNYFSALYFGLTTLTTVGFGDVVPVTVQGKCVVCFSIIAGVAVIPAQAAKFVDALIDLQREDDDRFTMRKMEQRTQKLQSNMNSSSFNTRSSRPVRDSVTDGKGPRGIPIEVQPTEWYETSSVAVAQRSVDDRRTRLDVGRTCTTCQATHHWSDADYCWSCGSALPAITPSDAQADKDDKT